MLRILFATAVAVLATLVLYIPGPTEACNEAVCASIVSKCMITQSCKCDLKNCSCCKACFSCLSYLYSECCSCVDMCPKPNNTRNALSKKSHVEDLPEAIPNLFQVLTAEPDSQQRWLTFTFPVDFDINIFRPKFEKEIKYSTNLAEQEVDPIKDIVTLNCSVAFMSQCMSWNKCKASCQSMGAASYRWFHDGCCQCVGDKCINYGINESRCLQCPLSKEVIIPEEALDYGEEDEVIESEALAS
ncbi:protein twisted gastrulation [Nilaparvata lugens]|uniref:protein twisted gastrulation n=1 Tax=Nilaparvata lugens TaxID=108931 RepID=UPI000B986867|nr:protein twisted gastrulation [Nilaparvata lugens]XP_022201069.1 protein twisted gastrulation [Nilaparvata lugens]XP_022201071.1 protein twisted gastrulation [Nilaparvata lugens]